MEFKFFNISIQMIILLATGLCLGISVTRAEQSHPTLQATSKSDEAIETLEHNQTTQPVTKNELSEGHIDGPLPKTQLRNRSSRMLMNSSNGARTSNAYPDSAREILPMSVQYGTNNQVMSPQNPIFYRTDVSPFPVEQKPNGISDNSKFFGNMLKSPLAENYITIKRLIMYAFSVSASSPNGIPDTNYYLYIPDKRKQDLLPDSPLNGNDYITSAPMFSLKDIFNSRNSLIPQPKRSLWGRVPGKPPHQIFNSMDTTKQIEPQLAEMPSNNLDSSRPFNFNTPGSSGSYVPILGSLNKYSNTVPSVTRPNYSGQNSESYISPFVTKPNYQPTQPNQKTFYNPEPYYVNKGLPQYKPAPYVARPRPSHTLLGNIANNVPFQNGMWLSDLKNGLTHPHTPQSGSPLRSDDFPVQSGAKFPGLIRMLEDESDERPERGEKSARHTILNTDGSGQLQNQDWPISRVEIMPAEYTVHTMRIPPDAIPHIQRELENARQVDEESALNDQNAESNSGRAGGRPFLSSYNAIDSKVRSGIHPFNYNVATNPLHNIRYYLPPNVGRYQYPKTSLNYPAQQSIINYPHLHNVLSYQLPHGDNNHRIIGGRPSLASGEPINTKVRSALDIFSTISGGGYQIIQNDLDDPSNYVPEIQNEFEKVEGVDNQINSGSKGKKDQDKDVDYRIIGGRPSLSSGEPISIKVRSGI